MGIGELLLLAIGLSMDAFAVAVCKGLSVGKPKKQHYLLIGLWFGGFQALMPTIGYFLGSTFEQYITAFDHWVAFVRCLNPILPASTIGLPSACCCSSAET